MKRACLDCGVLIDTGTRCIDCGRDRQRTRRPNFYRRGYDRAYQKARRAILQNGGGEVGCALRLPGCTGLATTVDHVIPLVHGGKDGPLVPACAHCNSVKGGGEWSRRIH